MTDKRPDVLDILAAIGIAAILGAVVAVAISLMGSYS